MGLDWRDLIRRPEAGSAGDPGQPMYLLPVGGLGNRVRFVSSALQACPDRRAVIVDVRTNMFAGRLSDFLQIPPQVRVREASFRSEKALIQLLKTATPLSRVSRGRIARYGATLIPEGCRFVSSYNLIEGMSAAYLPLVPIATTIGFPYDAVHIRGTDNKRACAMSPMAEFESFIERSERRVYVASDSDATKRSLQSTFGDKVFFREIGLRRDSEDDLRAAFEELWCLVRSVKFRGSKGSSFSSLAQAHRAAPRR